MGHPTTRQLLAALIVSFSLAACGTTTTDADEPPSAQAIADGELAQATFAGGCFWCMEPPFDKLDGVVSTISGYTAGEQKNPTYQQVSRGATGHTEAVQITYDPNKISFTELLDVFWRNIDPLAKDRQFCDGGTQYRTGIYAHDATQLELAEVSKKALDDSGRFDQPVVTEIEPLDTFYPAEDYHQDYYKKNPVRYKTYRVGCGRDRRLEQLWGDD